MTSGCSKTKCVDWRNVGLMDIKASGVRSNRSLLVVRLRCMRSTSHCKNCNSLNCENTNATPSCKCSAFHLNCWAS